MRSCEKIYLTLLPPTEEDPKSDRLRLLDALAALKYSPVEIPLQVLQRLHTSCLEGHYQITVTLVYREKDWVATDVEPGDTRSSHYGIAVDYGSTTIVMQLVDLNTGNVVAQDSEKNGQIQYGTDILTRITYAMEDSSHTEDLRRATIETFRLLLRRMAQETGIPAESCPLMIISGNTTMIHFLLQLDARTVFFAPYAPVTLAPGWFFGSELELGFSGVAYIIPAASNYIGGDIVSGLLNLDFCRDDEVKLFFDIGTNGELVIGSREWLLAGAGAAGPALEGYISRYGVRAQNGAIDTVHIQDGKLSFTTIGNQKPVGICGSGIIDLLAQMRIQGWINIAGTFNPDASSRITYLPEEDQYAVIYADAGESALGEPLYFSQMDISQYLDTKAAAHTMIDCILEYAGCSGSEIARCYLSGAFAAHSNLESAITIGVFPDLPRERYVCIANASLDGARALLLDRSRLKDIRYFTETLYCVQFASIPDFIIRMQAAKFIPHTDMKRYPSVMKRLGKNE